MACGYDALRDLGPGWWQPFATFSVGTVLFQWLIALIALIALNGWLARRLTAGTAAEAGDAAEKEDGR